MRSKKAMQTVKIVTQSGSDLTFDIAEKHGIVILPDYVIFGERSYRNNIDIHAEGFYDMLEAAAELPTSAHASPAEFMDAFKTCADCAGCTDIICIMMSEKTTGTIHTARMAAGLLAEDGFAPRVHVYDSKHVSYGLALAALEAADLAAEGKSAEEILAHLDGLVDKIRVLFTMETLEYAERGGRISSTQADFVRKLGIKPVLTFINGSVTRQAAGIYNLRNNLKLIENIFKKEYCGSHRVIIFHAGNPEGAETLREYVLALHSDAEVYIQWVGPVVGIYTGRGCVGMAFVSK